ncbi:thioredoxin-related transmembrane protein 2 [Juglans microcarpa x Juglans regia]|uniref:thioredoxin-related transmembrane protein 2 n=1 Tax=Juglans microcarpa x Juglans regia TaxID=2249226 RepID=UPI001B7F088B|nr:thioredoxin-related transmembrane protein 2 [Juglans microcarpa x Juglans regia]
MEKKRSPIEWLNLMVSEPYYLFHFLAFFSYLVVRSSASPRLSPRLTHHLLYREIQAILAFSLLTVIKMVRQETWEAFIADMLFFSKVLLLALALVMDYHLALWYLGIFFVIYILTQQPAYQGLGTSSKLTPLQLETLLTEGNTSRFWLVEFRASFSPACIRTSQCFPELSITYSHKNLSFGIVDIGIFPNAAEKFGIYLGGSMDQLPTYILFENAVEVSRIPHLDSEAKSSPPITKRLISRHFELDLRLLEYVKGN